MRGGYLACLAILAASPMPAQARSDCDRMIVGRDAASRLKDARLISRAAQPVRAANVAYVLAEPGWRVIWATPDQAERGVYFFRQSGKGSYRLIDTWGGVIAPDELQATAAWARHLKGGGPSEGLARCFAAALIAGK